MRNVAWCIFTVVAATWSVWFVGDTSAQSLASPMPAPAYSFELPRGYIMGLIGANGGAAFHLELVRPDDVVQIRVGRNHQVEVEIPSTDVGFNDGADLTCARDPGDDAGDGIHFHHKAINRILLIARFQGRAVRSGARTQRLLHTLAQRCAALQ